MRSAFVFESSGTQLTWELVIGADCLGRQCSWRQEVDTRAVGRGWRRFAINQMGDRGVAEIAATTRTECGVDAGQGSRRPQRCLRRRGGGRAHGRSNEAGSENCCLSTAAAESGVADDRLSLTPVGPVRPKAFADYSRSLLSTPTTSNTLCLKDSLFLVGCAIAVVCGGAPIDSRRYPRGSSSSRLSRFSFASLSVASLVVSSPRPCFMCGAVPFSNGRFQLRPSIVAATSPPLLSLSRPASQLPPAAVAVIFCVRSAGHRFGRCYQRGAPLCVRLSRAALLRKRL
uniref:Uncharacterized protein n=1 Tax=Plectus sambesii TaxID=2011161 RepID=A0A914UU01_9BILA